MYEVILSKQALKDLDKLKRAGKSYVKKVKELIDIVSENPYQNPPPYEKLMGDLQGYYSRRINGQHRFIYNILPNIDDTEDTEETEDKKENECKGFVHILRMWTHYE